MKPSVLAGLAVGVAIPGYGVYSRYRRDMNAARARLAAVERHVISTQWGEVEYAGWSHGPPLYGSFHPMTVAARRALRGFVQPAVWPGAGARMARP